MNKTTLPYFFVAALILAQPTQIKSSVMTTIGVVATTAAIAIGYIKYQEHHTDELPDPNRLIDQVAEGAKKLVDQIKKVKVE